jgi:hypothetical protein
METQTRFDLNAAIDNWRAELAAQSDLTTDMRRELETHLQDSITGLRQRGLSEEEAFWVARKRVGNPGQLGEECLKADPAAVWRERVFWMTLAVLLIWLWSTSSAIIAVIVSRGTTNLLIHEIPLWATAPHPLVDFGIQTLQVLIRILPVCWLAFFVAKGRLNADSRLIVFFRSRSRLAVHALIWSLLNSCVSVWSGWQAAHLQNTHAGQVVAGQPAFVVSFPFLINMVYSMSFPITFILLLVWLMPAHFQAKPKAT